MPLHRREVIVAALGLPLMSGTSLVLAGHTADPKPRRRAPSRSRAYHSTLVDGRTPKRIEWDGHRWSAAMGSTWNSGMDYCLGLAADRARFEIRPTPRDHGANDDPQKRRSEIHETKNLLPNGVPLWGAMSFNHHGWADPAGMTEVWGGVHGQIHMHKFGGSPALAFRRNGDGRFMVTTRGEFDTEGSKRWMGPLAFDQVHDLVYRLVLHPTDGELDVWVDGRRLVALKGMSIGSHLGGCYWCIGCYYAGGITCPVVAEFGNHAFPSTADLSGRVASPPPWPVS